VSDFVVIHGVMEILGEGDVNVAYEKLLSQLAPIANDISEVTFGFAKLMFRKYIDDKELIMNLVAEIADAPDIGTLRLPFYVETPGLRKEWASDASPILPPFQKFVTEDAAIGRLLAGYANLEIGLVRCVQMARGNDFDMVLKRMFERRDETRRINERTCSKPWSSFWRVVPRDTNRPNRFVNLLPSDAAP
jgi:hypothetical protein